MKKNKFLGMFLLILSLVLAFAIIGCGGGGGGSSSGSEPPNESNVVNTGGAVTQITPNHPKTKLSYLSGGIIPGSSYSYSIMTKSAAGTSAGNVSPRQSSLRAAAEPDVNINVGSFPADFPIMIFFDDLLYLNSIKENVAVTVNGTKIYGTVSISKDASNRAVLTFTPYEAFTANKTISITITKDMQNQGGYGMSNDLTITYTTSGSASGIFDGNGGFEKGLDGVTFVGDGKRMQKTTAFPSRGGSWFAAISSGDVLGAGDAIGDTMSSMILGPINEDIDTVNFYYNFISAEFDDYVDEGYDDTVMCTITGPNGTHTEFITSVDFVGISGNSSFTGLSSTMPDGGDSYTGQTGWLNKVINFDSVGTPAYITFTVTDVGDEILSSIFAVDDITY